MSFLDDIHAKKIDLYLHQQGIDATTADGKAMFQMGGVFAEFERTMIQEQAKAGLARARAQGRRLGRPTVPAKTENTIRNARKAGKGIKKIACEIGVGVSVVQRVING